MIVALLICLGIILYVVSMLILIAYGFDNRDVLDDC